MSPAVTIVHVGLFEAIVIWGDEAITGSIVDSDEFVESKVGVTKAGSKFVPFDTDELEEHPTRKTKAAM